MKITLDQLRDLQKVPNKSKVKFSWDFENEIEKLMKMIEKSINKEIAPKYRIEYCNYWKNNLKIKINDNDKLIEKLIAFNLAYNNTDERYWYIDPQFLVNELWKKTKVIGMWKISIMDKENIIEKFIKILLSIIEQY